MSTHSLSMHRQRGVVLVVSLLMLLVLTLIGLAATRSTTIEQRLTANQRDTAVAFQGAEAALRDGESLLNSAGLPNFALNTAGAYTETTMTVDWSTIDWEDPSATLAYEGGLDRTKLASTVTTPSEVPRYYVVLTTHPVKTNGSSLSADAPQVSKLVYYIYAYSKGLSGNSFVVLKSAYAR